MATWHTHYGKWWAVNWCYDGWFSLGIHVDFKQRRTSKTNIRYGPYADLHLGPYIFSIGVNPAYSTDIDSLTYRGGYDGNSH
jgi:hypothetical protein